MRETAAVKITSIICVTMLGVSYFAFVRQDGTVLLSLSSIIGAIAGYTIGIKVKRKR